MIAPVIWTDGTLNWEDVLVAVLSSTNLLVATLSMIHDGADWWGTLSVNPTCDVCPRCLSFGCALSAAIQFQQFWTGGPQT